MNKKAQGEMIIYLLEFIIAFILLKAFGPLMYEVTKNIPLGFVFKIILPSPESTALDYLKIFIDSFIVTGGTATIFSK